MDRRTAPRVRKQVLSYVLGEQLRNLNPAVEDFWLISLCLVHADAIIPFYKASDGSYVLDRIPVTLIPVENSLFMMVGFTPKDIHRLDMDFYPNYSDRPSEIPEKKGIYTFPLTQDNVAALYKIARKEGYVLTTHTTSGEQECKHLQEYPELGELSAQASKAIINNYILMDIVYKNVHEE